MVSKMIGVDIDGPFWKALAAYFNAKYLFPNSKVKLYRTRKGWHVEIDAEVPADKAITVRMALGDDPERIYVSELRAKIHRIAPDDILYEKKWYGGRWWERQEVKI